MRMDFYRGCSHRCDYCFSEKRDRMAENFKKKPSDFYDTIIPCKISAALNIFKDKKLAPVFQHKISIHVGGMSDPFQPCEKKYRISEQFLDYLIDNFYPVIWSTKGKILTEYVDKIRRAKSCIQISMIGKRGIEVLEKGATTYHERLAIIELLSSYQIPVVVRVQPLFMQYLEDVKKMVLDLKSLGINGLIVEGFKSEKKETGMIYSGYKQYTYSIKNKLKYILPIRELCRENSIRFLVGDNNMRVFGDDHNCCGFGNIEGYAGNSPCNMTSKCKDKEFCYLDLVGDNYADILKYSSIDQINKTAFYNKSNLTSIIKNKLNSGAILKDLNTYEQTKLQDGNVYYRAMTEEEIIKKFS